MSTYHIKHLDLLEAESIYILREVAAQFENPAMLFSGGKDSIIMVRLAEKAFRPAKLPFPLVHIDTGHNFPETIEFRDKFVKDIGEQLIVGHVQDSIDQGKVAEETGPDASRNFLQTTTLLDTLEQYKFDAAIGGGRRDEEKARAKERIFSFRDEFGQWEPKNQRPEIWTTLNGRKSIGQSIRVFPISNWTELDVWQYIAKENIELPSVYFSHKRECIRRNGTILANSEFLTLREAEQPEELIIRCRTVGDMTCTGVVESEAHSVSDIIKEVAAARITERGGRADDKRSEAAMEERKREGYF
ncbi:MAG: sulfate adenylyltransferase subunit CysD [Bacteroidia bacterium]|nr:sulfate adenylyltransferase subunit CysD [Bacteroidia bacterium]